MILTGNETIGDKDMETRKARDLAYRKDLLVDRVICQIKDDMDRGKAPNDLHELLYHCVGEADLRGMLPGE